MGPCVGGALAGLLYQNAFQAGRPAPQESRGHNYEECAKGDTKEVPEL